MPIYSLLQDPYLGSSLDAQDIPPISKCRKLLSGARYCKKFIDENGQPLYPANCNMSSSSCNLGSSTIIWREIELFYDTLVVFYCSKCQGLKVNPCIVTLTH